MWHLETLTRGGYQPSNTNVYGMGVTKYDIGDRELVLFFAGGISTGICNHHYVVLHYPILKLKGVFQIGICNIAYDSRVDSKMRKKIICSDLKNIKRVKPCFVPGMTTPPSKTSIDQLEAL